MRKLAVGVVVILLPVVLVFKSIFVAGSLAWGDAPHFFPEEIRELVLEPLAWTSRGNNFGGVNKYVFVWPLMALYGLISNNDLAIRILFYIPSVVFSVLGALLLTKYLKLSKVTQFFTGAVYLLNTYFLLLVDGGQVGVALAYGLFPFAMLRIKKFLDSPSLKAYYFSLFVLLFLTIADPRVAIIAVLTVAIWQVLELKLKRLGYLIPLLVAWIGVSMYWIFPLLKNDAIGVLVSSNPAVVRWYNPLLLFSPHWYGNVFGEITRPPVYFAGIPVLVFLGGLLKKERTYFVFLLLFLSFSFLTLGIIPFEKVPFGFAFRDSTKFFIPMILFAGILIGSVVDRFKNFLFSAVCFLYILFLIYPAMVGKMNFVLSSRNPGNDYQKIYENLKADDSFFRSVWFPERHPLTFELEQKPALNAVELAKERPFAAINAGEDVLNFLNNKDFTNLFRLFGIKYLVLSGNARQVSQSQEDEKSWNTILELVEENKNLDRVDWGVSFPVYKLKEDTYPDFYSVDQIVLVVGPDLGLKYIFTPSIYLEDGKWDPRILEGKDKGSIKILFNGKGKDDLVMGLLQKYFVSPYQNSASQWAVHQTDQYLKYKYELLIRGISFTDFDYSRGIAFSTIPGEKIKFSFNVPKDGTYILAVRSMNEKGSGLVWKVDTKNLKKGNFDYEYKNDSQISILNAVALVPESEYEKALNLANAFVSNFGIIDTPNLKSMGEIKTLDVSKYGTLKYKFKTPSSGFWVIHNQKYNELWKLKRGSEFFDSVPVYSMVNGFYVKPGWNDLSIEFRGQENVRWGIYFSSISLILVAIVYLWRKS